MPLPEKTQLQLADLRAALRRAVAEPPSVTTAPSPPALDDATMRELADQRPELAKRITDRAAALQQRAAEVAKAREGLKRIYAEALSRVNDMLKRRTR